MWCLIKKVISIIFSSPAQQVVEKKEVSRTIDYKKQLSEDELKKILSFFEVSENMGYLSFYEMQALKSAYESIYLKLLHNKDANEKIRRGFVNRYESLIVNRSKYNNQFISDELERYQEFLSNIDGKSLDNQQRRAVIVNEDNTLVVAGAGSGKTLTIAAKVSYLVKVLKVNPAKILLITFTKKASEEMAERVVSRLGINVEVRTFHSLGNHIIAVGDQEKRDIHSDPQKIIDQFLIEKLQTDIKLTRKMLHWYGMCMFAPPNPEEFDNYGSYLSDQKHISLQTLRDIYQEHRVKCNLEDERITLKNEYVKSLEELHIANYLFLNGIRYEYEARYRHKTSNEQYRQYKPDFYLVDYGIYLEHFGINEEGRVPWLSKIEEKRYLEGIKWKRKIHAQYGTKLIETYSYQFSNEEILNSLERQLKALGVRFNMLTENEIRLAVDGLKNKSGFKEYINLNRTFLTLFKSNNYVLQDLYTIINEAKKNRDKRAREKELLFFEIFKELYIYYQNYLMQNQFIDFNDMINHATSYIQNERVRLDYDYIIIDEYQDISQARYKLVKAIKEQTNAKLMAVGDDWQSIYRFAGSDVNLFTSFEKMFGATETLKIENTYRNSQQLIDMAGEFVMRNPLQIKKRLRSNKCLDNPITIVYYSNKELALMKALENIVTPSVKKSVLLLGRNNIDINFLEESKSELFRVKKVNSQIKISCSGFENLDITFLTVHRSKGLEADDVIILNCENTTLGFPNKISDDPILNYVLTASDEYKYGEERRLFYVALTRTKNKCILLSPLDKSEFIEELVETYDIPSIIVDELDRDELPVVKCPHCITGRLVLRQSKNKISFVGCSNYPGCPKTYKDTSILVNPIKCPNCNGYLVNRTGMYGEFKSCSNYPLCNNNLSNVRPRQVRPQRTIKKNNI